MLAHRRNRRGAPPRSLPLVVFLLMVALSAGCGGTDDEAAQEDPSPTDTADVDSPAESPATDVASPTGSPGTASPPQVPAEEATPLGTWVEVAVADFAERGDVEGENVTVATAERVTWRDGSLGCPEEGRVYTQALVEGYRIILEANGQRAAYHGRTGEEPTFCPDPAANGTLDA